MTLKSTLQKTINKIPKNFPQKIKKIQKNSKNSKTIFKKIIKIHKKTAFEPIATKDLTEEGLLACTAGTIRNMPRGWAIPPVPAEGLKGLELEEDLLELALDLR